MLSYSYSAGLLGIEGALPEKLKYTKNKYLSLHINPTGTYKY